jgi:uncharacterized protein YkwD
MKATIIFAGVLLMLGHQATWAQNNENDGKVSALKPRPKIVIYEHSHYEGISQTLGVGKHDIDKLEAIGNDQLSSVKVPKGMRVILYEHANFQGEQMELLEDTWFVGEDFNDLTSSIVVEEVGKTPTPKPKPDIDKPQPTPTNVVSFKGCPTGQENVSAENEAFEKKVMEIVNTERKKLGKPALVWNANLARAARYHAADMATDGYFEHDSYDVINGQQVKVCSTFERIGKFGRGYAENIAWGSTTPEGAMNQWMNSPGHYQNIMGSHESIGVGFYKNRWVQVFGSK